MATKKNLLKLIRLNCSECMGGPRASERVTHPPNAKDIEECTAIECAFFPYRFGTDPEKSKARVEAGRRLGKMNNPVVKEKEK